MEKFQPLLSQVLKFLAQLLNKNKREITKINGRKKSYANSIIASPSILGKYV
jgi:hypothetical protein